MNIKLGDIHIASWKFGQRIWPIYNDGYGDDFVKDRIKYKQDDVVLKPGDYILVIDYPVTVFYTTPLTVEASGLTRGGLVQFICRHYKKMYKEEDSGSKIKAGNIPGMYNRNETNGKYGIYGHDIGDLVLCSAEVSKKNVITLGVDS